MFFVPLGSNHTQLENSGLVGVQQTNHCTPLPSALGQRLQTRHAVAMQCGVGLLVSIFSHNRLSLYSGSFATVAHPGISFRLALRPVGPHLRFVSPHSACVSCRAPESSPSWRRSVVSFHSCLICVTESSRSCRRSSCVLPVLRSRARPSSDSAPDGHRMDHHLEVPVRCRGLCMSVAAARVGRVDFPMSSQSLLYAYTPFAVTMTGVSSSSSVSPSVALTRAVAPLRRSGSNAGRAPLASKSQPPSSRSQCATRTRLCPRDGPRGAGCSLPILLPAPTGYLSMASAAYQPCTTS